MQSRTALLAAFHWIFSGHSDIVVVVEIYLGSFGMAAALSIEFNPWYCDLGHLSISLVSTRVGHVQRLIKLSCSVMNVYMCRKKIIQQLYTELNASLNSNEHSRNTNFIFHFFLASTSFWVRVDMRRLCFKQTMEVDWLHNGIESGTQPMWIHPKTGPKPQLPAVTVSSTYICRWSTEILGIHLNITNRLIET